MDCCTLRFVTVLVLLCCLVGCRQRDTDYSLQLDDVAVAGPGSTGLSVVGEEVHGIIVYFHGADQNARTIRDSEKHRNVFDPALRRGFAVVAANADGNAFGNPASLQDYRRLIAAAKERYGAGASVYFVAESMGAIAALTLIKEDAARQVKGMVGISPLMGLPDEVRAVSFVRGPWHGDVPATADPLSWEPEAFAGRSFRLYASAADKVIPANASSVAFKSRFGSVADIEVVGCQGGHVASDCYRGDDVAGWLSKLA